MQRKNYQAYAAATQTVAKTKQIVLLYDGAIRFVQQAMEAIKEKRYEDRYQALMKASEIVSGLQGCLDFEQGGTIAGLLYHFYSNTEQRIFSIHHSNSLEECKTLIDDLKQMREVWHEIDNNTVPATVSVPAAPTNGSESASVSA